MFNHLKIEEAAWIAGIIDGEGSIHINWNSRSNRTELRISIGMTCETTIRRIYKLIGTGTIGFDPKKRPAKDS